MNKVNTIIIGAGRSGTTSLYAYMDHHPEINFSITKELHYFSIDDLYGRGEKYFHSLFKKVDNKIVATADTYLLIDKEAPQKIKNYNPDIKIIVMLREPVARSYSNFNYSKNFGHEDDITFLQSLEKEKSRLHSNNIVDRNNLCHFYGSLYHEHLTFWLQFFPRDQFIILKLDDLKNDPEGFYKDLCNSLNISYHPFTANSAKFNAVSGVKNKWLQQLLLNRESGTRKFISFILRPFRNLIIRSGVIDKVYSLNKKEVAIPQLSETEKEEVKKYFENDLALLNKEFNINFNEP
ncbi:MAG: sulfotransferase family protein [Chitinophagales bacterium]